MTRPTRSTIRTKSRTITVERKPIRGERVTLHEILVRRSAQRIQVARVVAELPERPILAEVERCLAHRPLRFPEKLWGEVL